LRSFQSSLYIKIREVVAGWCNSKPPVITNDSLARLGLREGLLATAKVKAPWVILHQSSEEPACSVENRLRGTISRMTRGEVNTEYVLRLADGIELCALVATESGSHSGLKEGDTVWPVFNLFCRGAACVGK
jgi:molybdate transport system regulatory protein